MAYLIHIGLALLVQIAWELELGVPGRHPWVVLALAGVPYLLGALAHRSYLRGRFRLGELWLRALSWSPVLLHAAAVLLAGSSELVEAWAGRPVRWVDWPHPLLLATLLPFGVYALAAIDARARLGSPPKPRVRAARRLQLRLLAFACLPIASYVLISALVGWLPGVRVRIETVALWNAAYAGSMLLGFAAGVPWLLRNTWETEPMPAGVERGLLEDVARLARFPLRHLSVWRTGHTVANAAIVGVFPRQRVVLFSDLLVAQLDLAELASVFAHEIGHAKCLHVPIFAAWAMAALFGGDLLAAQLAPHDAWWGAAVLLCALLAWALAFGWMSRRFELEADLYSLRLVGDAGPLIRALEQVSGVHNRARTSWRHFSTERRVEFLEQVVRDPSAGTRLERKLRWVAGSGILACVLVLGLEGRALAERWQDDHVVLDLRLGDYASARERVENDPGADPELAELVDRTRELDRGDLDSIEARARLSIAGGDLRAAHQWLDLGALRGSEDMAVVEAILSRLREPPRPSARSLLEQAPQSWRSVLEPAIRRLAAP